jgi:AcrR family transcriptional regulator
VAHQALLAPRIPSRRQPRSYELIAQQQRERIIFAFAEEASEKGYRGVTVTDVVRRAGVARKTFYDYFPSKEVCFIATSEFGVKEALRQVVDAAIQAESWTARIQAGLAAFLDYAASEPALARTCIVETLAAGPAAVGRYEHSIQAFVPLFWMGRKIASRELPRLLEETIVGGIFWIIYQRIVSDEAGRVEDLLPELIEFSLTPYLGAEGAKAARTGDAAALPTD